MMASHQLPSGVGCYLLSTRDVPPPDQTLLVVENVTGGTVFAVTCEVSTDQGTTWGRVRSWRMTATLAAPDVGLELGGYELVPGADGFFLKSYCVVYKPLDELPTAVTDPADLWVRVSYRRDDGSVCATEGRHLTQVIRGE